ncbi:hypothetical protein PS720_03662 [Pseudomonas fluorescens]|nr:hypothetical protein PS720_03662 [Pseudomonas fluorescens]
MSRCPARRCAWLRKAPAITPDAIKKCGRGLAREGGLTAELDVGSDRVHIRYLGHSHYGFRPYGGSLLERPKSNQKAFVPTLGTSPRLGVPVIRQVFGGPPPRAIHGAGRLNRHPCRFTPQIPVEFRPACLTERLRSKARSRSRTARFASWLGGWLIPAIAGKSAPTEQRPASHRWPWVTTGSGRTGPPSPAAPG